ncbi:hypothetical protein AXX12_16285 [Anaerosporomusa subterranea]|uniref:Uncharacterized protein n=1 Tax=Anaerosporomusa subterranea TaxID=1794912 RepID=A0A154BLK8_ANASB|nr:hypothetical protein AXX12_16285 [Anaerosporomusa subterranea]
MLLPDGDLKPENQERFHNNAAASAAVIKRSKRKLDRDAFFAFDAGGRLVEHHFFQGTIGDVPFPSTFYHNSPRNAGYSSDSNDFSITR